MLLSREIGLKKKLYFEKNKQWAAWLPQSLLEWFDKYLIDYSFGESRAARFKVFLYELQKQQEKGITISNPKETKEKEQSGLLKRYGEGVVSVKEVCLRRPSKTQIKEWVGLTEEQRNRACEICKVRDRKFWKTCQELKKEYVEAQRQ